MKLIEWRLVQEVLVISPSKEASLKASIFMKMNWMNSVKFIGYLKNISPGKRGTTTLKQASHLSVRTFKGLVNPSGPNAKLLLQGAAEGAVMGVGVDNLIEVVK